MPNKIQIDLSLNDDQFTAKVQSAEGTVKSFSGAVNGLQTSLKGLGNQAATGSISDLEARLRAAREQLERTDRSSKNYENATKRIAVITKQLSAAQTEAAQSIKSFQSAYSGVNLGPASGSVADLNIRLQQARAALEGIDPASKKYEMALKRAAVIASQLSVAQSNTNAAIAKTQKNLGLTTTSTDRATWAMISFSQLISDSAYGIRGMANNFSPLVQNFIMLRKESGSTREAVTSFFKSMAGPTGAIAAVSLISAGLEMWAMHSQKAKTETKDLAKETAELKERVRTLKATYDDLSKAMAVNRKNIWQNGIAMQKELIAEYEKNLRDGGKMYNKEFIPYTPEQMKSFQEGITAANAKIKDFQDEMNAGGKSVKQNLDLIRNFSRAASEGGAEGIKEFVDINKLTEDNIDDLFARLQDYKQSITSVSGDLGGKVTADQKEIAYKLGLTREEVIKAIGVIEKYRESINKEPEPNGLIPRLRKQIEELKKSLQNAGTKPVIRAIETEITRLESYINYLENLDKQTIKDIPEVKFRFNSESGDKMFEALKDSFEKRGIPWDATHQAFAAAMVLKAKPDETATATIKNVPKELKPVRTGENPDIQLTPEELDSLNFQAELLTNVFGEVGDSIVDGMFEGKLAVDELTESIGKLILKMLLMKGIEAGVNALLPGIGSFLGSIFHDGGIVSQPTSVRAISFDAFKGAKKYHTGLMPNEMPAILTKDEMVLTSRQQSNLFSMLNRSLSKTAGLGRQTMNVKVTGGLRTVGKDVLLQIDDTTQRIKSAYTV